MAQNREQLEALLSFIEKLSNEPGNEWFAERIRNRYSSIKDYFAPTSLAMNKDINLLYKRVSDIEKYLGLDYSLDSADSIIDYSWVEDDEVRSQLVSDNREMLRYRYGTRSHKIDFVEFCKYAHFQVEMLLNYLYEPTEPFTYIADCVEHIKNYNPKGNIDEKCQTAANINYSVKMNAFAEEFFYVEGISEKGYPKKDQLYWTLLYVSNTRNQNSHRGMTQTSNDIFNKWLFRTPFDEVSTAIKRVSEKIRSINKTTFLVSHKPWIKGTITNVYESAGFIRLDEENITLQITNSMLKNINDAHKGDSILVKINSKGDVADVKI